MTNKLETIPTPRRLLNVLRFWLERANERSESGDITELVELRALLAAPVVERQPMNQCDGCRAGKPLENGKLHIMVNAGGYRDVMACTAHLYAEQPAPVAVPDGWKLVPIEPTTEMLEAAAICYGSDEDCYKVMIANAPDCLDKVKELNQ